MRISERRLPKTECYPCTRREAKGAFGGVDIDWISLGAGSKYFAFDRRSTHRPKIRGTVVASATYTPERKAYVCLYVVRKADYPAQAQDDFRTRVLPEMRRWLEGQMGKPDTAIFGYEEMIVEWDGKTHRFHGFTLRTGLSGKQQAREDNSSVL